MTHPSDRLWTEVVRIATATGWSLDAIVDLEHPVRRRVLAELALPAPPAGGPGTARPAWRG